MTSPAHVARRSSTGAEEASPEPNQDQPVKKPRRGMLAFYVGVGVICLLLIGFYFAWTPLRVWYSAEQVMRFDEDQLPADYERLEEYLLPCLEPASQGNRRAMEAVVRACAFPHKVLCNLDDRFFDVAAADPELFFDVLEDMDNGDAETVLWRMANSCRGAARINEGYYANVQLKLFAADFERFSKTKRPDLRRVSQAALAFLRRRFAGELLEAKPRIEWEGLLAAWKSYVRRPSEQTGMALLALLPDHAFEWEGVLSKTGPQADAALRQIADGLLDPLLDRIAAADPMAVRVGFKSTLLLDSCAAPVHTVLRTLGEVIPKNPKLFLTELKRHGLKNVEGYLGALTCSSLKLVDNISGQRAELKRRIAALASVKDVALQPEKMAALGSLREGLKTLPAEKSEGQK